MNAAIREQNVNFHQLSNILRSMLPTKTQKLVMFGPGLESGTSGIATKILEDTTGMFKTVGMFPGQFDGMCEIYISYIAMNTYMNNYIS